MILENKKEEDHNVKGIFFEDFMILISKEIKEKDLNASLTEAFKILDKENKGFIDSTVMRDLL